MRAGQKSLFEVISENCHPGAEVSPMTGKGRGEGQGR